MTRRFRAFPGVLPSLRATGRGRCYSPLRGAMELGLRALYAGGWPARVWGRVPASRQVHLVEHAIDAGRAGRAPLRLAFASDLHLGPTTARATLDAAFARLSALAPDVLVLGGDYVFLDATDARARELEERVAGVPARLKLAVLGNHDLWAEHPRLERALERAGVRVLVNDAARLPPPHDDVAIVGLDDPWTGLPDGERALAAAGDATALVGVTHSPDGLPFLRDPRVRLVLAGHTHGGQVALPGPRPIVVPGRLGKRFPFGLHDVGGAALFVSRGVGATELPIRAFAPPDVALLTVR